MIESKNTKISIIDSDGKETELQGLVKFTEAVIGDKLQPYQERVLETFDLAPNKDKTVSVLVIGSGNVEIKALDIINKIDGFKGIIIIDDPWRINQDFKNALMGLGKTAEQASQAIKAFKVAMLPNAQDLMYLNHRPLPEFKESKPTNFTPERDHGWYRQFENKRRWR